MPEKSLISLLKPLNRIQGTLTGSKISMSSTKFVFFGRSENQDGHPGRCVNKGGTWYSGACYVAPWAPYSSCAVKISLFTERKKSQRYLRLVTLGKFLQIRHNRKKMQKLPLLKNVHVYSNLDSKHIVVVKQQYRMFLDYNQA